MKQISTEKEIKKMSAQNIGVYRLDDGRFAFMGRIYEDKQALDEEIERTEKIARRIHNSWLYKLFNKRKKK